jgi:hypothetical protein
MHDRELKRSVASLVPVKDVKAMKIFSRKNDLLPPSHGNLFNCNSRPRCGKNAQVGRRVSFGRRMRQVRVNDILNKYQNGCLIKPLLNSRRAGTGGSVWWFIMEVV